VTDRGKADKARDEKKDANTVSQLDAFSMVGRGVPTEPTGDESQPVALVTLNCESLVCNVTYTFTADSNPKRMRPYALQAAFAGSDGDET